MTELISYKPMEVLKHGNDVHANHYDSHLLVWGQTGNGQLGIEANEEGFLSEPTNVPMFNRHRVFEIAIGVHHSLFLTKAGLFSGGCNDSGQLGHCKTSTTPGHLESFNATKIVAVDVGEGHCLALAQDGTLYSWGDNQYGQLGRQDGRNNEPRPVQFPVKAFITSIACGENHNIALAKDGALYTWGHNKDGQLGHGISGAIALIPQAITSIRNLLFTKIAAGGYHSFALTISGALFGWGLNRNGQLGLGNTDTKPFPICCRALRQQRVRHVACGLYHTVVLTMDGGVFTFGAGNHGQLGHNFSSDELLPKKIMELMGSTVTQVACGRFHTMAYVPTSGRVYAFGLGAYGQLGVNDTTRKLTPCPVNMPSGANNNSSDLIRIAAGGNSSAVYLEKHTRDSSSNSMDHRDVPEQQYVMNSAVIELMVNWKDAVTVENNNLINTVFSYLSAWNGAFLKKDDDAHYGCSSTNHGLDIDEARSQLSRLPNNNHNAAVQLAYGTLEKNLLPSLKSKVPDVEALRAFLILPFLNVFSDPSCYATIQSNYGNGLLSLDKIPAQIIDKWLLRSPPRHFKYYLNIFKKVVSHILCKDQASTEFEVLTRQRGLEIALEVMKKLYNINESGSEQLVPCTEFYVSEITDKVDIKTDYINWYTKSNYSMTGQPIMSFCSYAFVFDAQAKTILLNADALLQMQQAIDQAHRLNLFNILASSHIDPIHPCLVIRVSRDNIIQDTIRLLGCMFMNEEAVDEGGVKKEFFLLILKGLLDVKYGMFRYNPESRMLWFNSTSFEGSDMYGLIGLICGLAIYNTTIIDLPFPLALYKKLLNKKVNLDDLRELDPLIGKSLQDLLDYEERDVEDVFGLTFSILHEVYGEVQTIDLIPNGRTIDVTQDNKNEYVNSYVDYILNSSVKHMFDAFNSGFHRVCGGKVLSFFHPLELQAMVVGNEEYDWEELEKNCDYKGEFYRYHKTIEMFWDVFHELSHEQKKQFLLYLTGCDRIPIQGMKSLKITIQPMSVTEEFLPVAHTCFNLLDLPREYSSKEKLRCKLLHAIDNTRGFGLV